MLSSEPLQKFTILVKSSNYIGPSDDEEDEPAMQEAGACLKLCFEYTPKYPDEPPLMEIEDLVNIEEDDLPPLRILLEEQVSDVTSLE